ncbi:MAG: hypothetical protein ACOC8N_01725, partial [Spirochaetota bacterium]
MRRSALAMTVLAAALLGACTLEVLSDFAVEAVSVPEEGVVGTGREPLVIRFSKEADPREVDRHVRVEREDAVEVATVRECRGREVTVTPDREWEPHRRFWLIVDGALPDIHGKTMGRGFARSFRSTDRDAPVSAVLIAPRIIDGVVAGETGELELSFSAPVDSDSVERELSLSPPVAGFFQWPTGSSCVYHLTGAMARNRFYTLSLSGDARDAAGNPIRPFIREFEYFPNQAYPRVTRVLDGRGDLVFDPAAPGTFVLEGDRYVIPLPLAEKDLSLRVEFSSSMDTAGFADGVRISPFAEWEAVWLSGSSVRIGFPSELTLDGRYQVSMDRGLEDAGSLPTQHTYLFDLNIRGPDSRPLEWTAGDFTGLEVDAELTSGGSVLPAGPPSLETGPAGLCIRIAYGGDADPEQVQAELTFHLEFLRAGFPDHPLDLDQKSLQDAFSVSALFGSAPAVERFTWTAANRCGVTCSRFAHLG